MIYIKEPPREHGQHMSMMAWYATDGGRRCPQCGRFAKPEHLGSIGGTVAMPTGTITRISMYGHLLGYGCNK